MGTRADFYIGRTTSAEWLGSCAWDGHPGSLKGVMEAQSEVAYRAAVAERIAEDDGTLLHQGWPWPWVTSKTTDFAYAWDDGVWVSDGHHWIDAPTYLTWAKEERDEPWLIWQQPGWAAATWPDMTLQKNFVASGVRSGIISIRSGPGGLSIE